MQIRQEISDNNAALLPVMKRILVLDPEPDLAEKIVANLGFEAEIDWFRSMEEFGPIGRLARYNLIVASSEARPVDGLDLAYYADAFLPHQIRVILVTTTDKARLNESDLPSSVMCLTERSKLCRVLTKAVQEVA